MRLLVDAGPLVALHNARDPDHEACRRVVASRTGVLRTTWPAVAEAMYLMSRVPPSQRKLLSLIGSGRLEVADVLDLVDRIAVLMEKYEDVPMDFTDATLVAVAERERHAEVFTLDADFRIYRVGRRSLAVLP